jgi:hypothetical protein
MEQGYTVDVACCDYIIEQVLPPLHERPLDLRSKISQMPQNLIPGSVGAVSAAREGGSATKCRQAAGEGGDHAG